MGMEAIIAHFPELRKPGGMTGRDKHVLQIISGFRFLPESDRKGLIQTVRFLRTVFGERKNRSPENEQGLTLLQQGVMGLLPSLVTSIFSKNSLSKQFASIVLAAEKLDPEFVRSVRGATT